MKILKRLLGCEGKMPLSTAQTVGLISGVVVAAVAAGHVMLSGPKTNQDTVFSAKDEPEIVYVAGGSTAGEVREFGAKEADAGVLYAQRAGKRHSFDFGQEKIEDYYANRPDYKEQEQGVEAYKMDGSYEGLASTKRAREKSGSADGPFDINNPMAGLQDKLSEAMNQAQANRAKSSNSDADVQQAASEALEGMLGNGGAKGSGKYGMADGMARANGTFSSTPLQAGRPGSRRSGVLNGAEAGSATGESESATGIVNLTPRYSGGRHGVVGAGQKFSNLDDTLEGMRKRSADVAGSRTRSSVEAAKSFLDSEQMSGGIHVNGLSSMSDLMGEGTQAYSNDAAGSFDSNMPNPMPSMAAMESALEEIDAETQEFIAARDALEEQVHDFVDHANRVSWYLCWMPPSVAKEGITLLLLLDDYSATKDKIDRFQDKYGKFEDEDENPYSNQLRERLNWSYFQDALWPGTAKKQWDKWKESNKTAEGSSSGTSSTENGEAKERTDNNNGGRTNGSGSSTGGDRRNGNNGPTTRKDPRGDKVNKSSLALE